MEEKVERKVSEERHHRKLGLRHDKREKERGEEVQEERREREQGQEKEKVKKTRR